MKWAIYIFGFNNEFKVKAVTLTTKEENHQNIPVKYRVTNEKRKETHAMQNWERSHANKTLNLLMFLCASTSAMKKYSPHILKFQTFLIDTASYKMKHNTTFRITKSLNLTSVHVT